MSAPTYTLTFPGGSPAEDEVFTSLDQARDVAFEVATDFGLDVHITQQFGAAEHVVEIVEG